MPRYRVQNRITKEAYEVEAPFAQDACERLGWMIGDCFIELLREGPFSDITEPPQPIPNEPHQKLIDGLTVMALREEMTKTEALAIIERISAQRPGGSENLAEAILIEIRKDYGLDALRSKTEDRYQSMSILELEERLGEISYELRPVMLPFRSFGDYQREQKLGLEAGYIEDELQRRS